MSGSGLEVQEVPGGFTVSFKGVELLRHDAERPMIEIGTGEADYRPNKRHQAYFNPVDRNKRMIGLREFSIGRKSDRSGSISFGETLAIRFSVVDGRLHVLVDLLGEEQDKRRWNRFTLHLPATPGEHVYGFGEQYTRLDMRGKTVPIWTQEPGLARDHSFPALIANAIMGAGGKWHTTYFPQASFVSSRHYFLVANTHARAELDFTARDHHRLHFWGIPGSFVLDAGGSIAEVLGSKSAHLGRQPRLPDWAVGGAWLGIGGGLNEERDGEASVQWKVRKALDANVKVTAVWCEDWTGVVRTASYDEKLFWNWEHDKERYPGLPGYIEELHRQGIKFLGYNNCFLMSHGNLYKEAEREGFLVKRADGSPYAVKMLSAAICMLDLTSPACRDWIKGVITRTMIGIGLDGWMCDFGEYLPVDAVLHSGEDPALVHNEYPVLWAKVNHEAVAEAGRFGGEGAIVFFNRSGGTGSSRYSPLVWAGDQQVTFQMGNGLASVIPAGVSLGFSGVGHHHSDIGGYFGIGPIRRTKEVFMRWAEHAAFTVVMRTHCRKDFTAEVDWQWYSDEETLQHFAKFSRIHAAMLPYTRHVLDEYQELGLPAMRHPWIHYESDTTLHGLKYQYLFGRDVLVAPVYKKGAKAWKVYLPDDEWIHLWSGAAHGKGWVAVDAPVGKPPVFYRAGARHAALLAGLPDA